MKPKGKLLIIGGGEYKGEDTKSGKNIPESQFKRFEILKELLHNSKNHHIEVITTGSTVPEQIKKSYQKAFHHIGYKNPGFMSITNRMEARSEQFINRLNKAGGVFFTGGDQFRISTILGGTKVVDVIRKRYKEEKNFLVAGTSAGAMVMSRIMIASGGTQEALYGDDLKTSSGIGILSNCIIDTHFIKRGRFGRLAQAIILNPEQLGIGLGEDTALIISNGSDAECRGSGMVVIIDGKYIRQTNVMEVKENEALYVENLRVHLLVKKCRFSIKTRKLLYPTQINPKTKKTKSKR